MWFNFFKKKTENNPKTFDGRFVTDSEISEMTKPKGESFIKKEMKDIYKSIIELKSIVNNGR